MRDPSSTDARRVCTRIKAAVPVASIKLKLDEVKGPGKDFWRGGPRGAPDTPVDPNAPVGR